MATDPRRSRPGLREIVPTLTGSGDGRHPTIPLPILYIMKLTELVMVLLPSGAHPIPLQVRSRTDIVVLHTR